MIKYYAVIGEHGSDVYTSWNDCQSALDRFPGARHRSFNTAELAWSWICDGSISNDADNDIKLEQGLDDDLAPAVVPEDIQLSEEQKQVVKLCEQGESIFFTGSAGTGKSVCLRHIIKQLRSDYRPGVYVTASTGIAAINIGGQTLHSWSGVGLAKERVDVLHRKLSTFATKRWLDARVLIIDEISMIDGRLFDKLEQLARLVRRNPKPFGGIQLVVCGDFFQLPPVPDSLGSGQKVPIKFAFEAETWNAAIPNMLVLKQVFRQKEGDLISMLNMMRLGEIDPLGLAIFRSVARKVQYDDGVEPTELFSLRSQVENANKTRLNALPGKDMVYQALDIPGRDIHGHLISAARATKMLDETLAPRELKLRIGAQVMLTKNDPQDKSFVNGSLGTIISFDEERPPASPVLTEDDRRNGKRPSWGNVEPTAAPVTNGSPRKGQSPSKAQREPDTQRYPRVRFANGSEKRILPESFEAVNAIGGVEATRRQVPLILAWALSIHKSQGQTLQRVKVNLDGVFEKGQAYVAVSRATGLEGLQVINFRADRIMAHPRVIAWSRKIQEMRDIVPVEETIDSEEEGYWVE